MAHLFHVFTIIFLLFTFTLAAPVKFKSAAIAVVAANHLQKQVTPIHRTGGKNDVIGGGVRDKDWHKQDGKVQPHDTKGLSFNKAPVDPAKLSNKQAAYSIKPTQLKGTDFKAVHDGGRDGHAPGHVTLAYKGPPATDAELKQKLNGLPFKKTLKS